MTEENDDFGDIVPDDAKKLPSAIKKKNSLTASGAKDQGGHTDDE